MNKKMNEAKAYYNKGHACLSRGDDDQAIYDFSEAIRLYPNYEEAYIIRGKVYYYKECIDQAIPDFSEVIRLNSNNAEAYYFRGNAYRGKREYDKSISDFNEVIRLDPNDTVAYYFRGITYSIKGDYDRAISDYDEVMRLNPNDAWIYNIRGNTYRNKGNYNRAILDFDEAIRLNPNLAEAYFNRGNVHGDKEDYGRAIADYESALRIDPDYLNARNAIRNIKNKDNKADKQESKQSTEKVIVLIWIILALEFISLISSCYQYSLSQAIADGVQVSMKTMETSGTIDGIISLIYLITWVISAVMFIRWFRQAYSNLNQKVTGLLYTKNWTVYCWFIPMLCFYKPYQIMKELHCKTEELLIKKGILSAESLLPSSSLSWWWTFWLVETFIGNFMYRHLFRAETIDPLVYIILDICGILLALITIKMIKDYSQMESLLTAKDRFAA